MLSLIRTVLQEDKCFISSDLSVLLPLPINMSVCIDYPELSLFGGLVVFPGLACPKPAKDQSTTGIVPLLKAFSK